MLVLSVIVVSVLHNATVISILGNGFNVEFMLRRGGLQLGDVVLVQGHTRVKVSAEGGTGNDLRLD